MNARELALALDPIIERGTSRDEPREYWVRLSVIVANYGWQAAMDRYPEARRIVERLEVLCANAAA